MGAFSSQFWAVVSPAAALLVALGASLLVGCEEKQDTEAAPTEPWLKDEAERNRKEAPSQVRYQLEPGAHLSITLPTRGSKPTGRLSRVEGYVDFDLKDLARSHGRIVVSLSRLEMENLPTPKDAETKDRAPELYDDATLEAQRWLGLGEDVAADVRTERGRAVYEFDSLRSLSHQSAHIGSIRKSEKPGKNRQVYATSDGELSLGGLSVKRQFSTTLLFHFLEEDEVPDSIVVTLRAGVVIPLSEYEIVPRGPDGHENAQRKSLIGDVVGSRVTVQGSLRFVRPGAGPEVER